MTAIHDGRLPFGHRSAALEEWRPAGGYEGRYEVSNLGRIRPLPRNEMSAKGVRRVRGGILNPSAHTEGYLHVSLRINGKLKLVRVHRLVALAFLGSGNALHTEVAHLDGNPANARADNLKWVSKVENEHHKRLHGTLPRGERSSQTTLTEADVHAIRASREARKVLAERYGISVNSVDDIRGRRRWRHI